MAIVTQTKIVQQKLLKADPYISKACISMRTATQDNLQFCFFGVREEK